MPISGDEYDIGRVDLSLFLFRLLRDSFPSALNAEELQQIVAKQNRDVRDDELTATLKRLVETGRAESKSIGGVVYL